jgi:hypothetical protein
MLTLRPIVLREVVSHVLVLCCDYKAPE